jgi:hypothetical protein
MISIVNIKSRLDAPLDKAPDNAVPISRPPPPPPPPAPTLANRRKFSIDGMVLVMRGAGHLVDFFVANTSAGTRYLQIFYQDSLPSAGSKPDRVLTLPTLGTTTQVITNGWPFETGICLAMSSTQFTLTLVTAADAIIDATFRMK